MTRNERTMYDSKEPSRLEKTFLVSFHFLVLCFVFWLLFGGGLPRVGAWFGWEWSLASVEVRGLLFFSAVCYFLRLLGTSFVFVQRKMTWAEVLTVSIWIAIIHFTMAWLGGKQVANLGLVHGLGFLLYVVGSFLNTGSEWMRHVWKQDPANKGKIYTEGLFKYSMHINFFGDVVLFSGFALMTCNIFAFLIPVLMAILFVFINIPELDKYLAKRYGHSFDEYAQKTKKFIPFVY